MNESSSIILFDGVCKLCNGWVRFIIRFDKSYQFKLCSVQSKRGQELLKRYHYPQDHFNTMLLIKDNNAYEKSKAFLLIMKQLGFPFFILYIFKLLPKGIRDGLYNCVAQHRYQWFGKYESCPINFSIDKKRFLCD